MTPITYDLLIRGREIRPQVVYLPRDEFTEFTAELEKHWQGWQAIPNGLWFGGVKFYPEPVR